MAKVKHIAIDNTIYDIEPSENYVTGVKGDSESSYRTGNVNITKSNIGLGNVGNFKAVSTVANQGLTNTEKSNARTNIGAGTSSFSGSYNDLTNKPTIPTVNNATLTIQKNGTNVQTFTANQSTNATANITVPTTLSGLTNDIYKLEYTTLTADGNNYIANISKAGYRLIGATMFINGTTPFVKGINCTGGTGAAGNPWTYALLFDTTIPSGNPVYVDLLWIKV